MKLKCNEPLSNFACKFNLRRYTKADQEVEQINSAGGGGATAAHCWAGVSLIGNLVPCSSRGWTVEPYWGVTIVNDE